MDTQIYPEDYRCPCCFNFIYINFACTNKHNMCENCYMKLTKCPVCRDEKIINSIIGNDIVKVKCKNKNRGCNLDVYCFDDEHELECLYNPFHCKFCNLDINDVNFGLIITHFNSNCVNTFKCLEYIFNINNSETGGRKYNIEFIDPVRSLINIDNQYFIMMIPKISQHMINFAIFSINDKYKLSNHKIKIISTSNIDILENTIHYKKIFFSSVPLDNIRAQNKLSFTVQNMFIINRKMSEKKFGNVTYVETNSINGEPGSAGNWTFEDFQDITNRFMNIFKK